MRRSNPLALAVLACLAERPMHPYEMATTLRQRDKQASIKLNYGSLYSVVESLQRGGLIEPRETIQDGRRPARTVYQITEAGQREFVDWLSVLISVPAKEYTQFEAGLSLLPGVSPDEGVELLAGRCGRLEVQIRAAESVIALCVERKLPRIFWIEGEYRLMLQRAELAWVQALSDEIAAGRLDGLPVWQAFHDQLSGPDGGPSLPPAEADPAEADPTQAESARPDSAEADSARPDPVQADPAQPGAAAAGAADGARRRR